MDKQGMEYKRLTAEDVRRVEGFENKTAEEVQIIILALEKLSALIYKKLTKHKPPPA